MPVSGSYPMRSSLPNHAAVLLRASPSAQPLLGPRRSRQRWSRPSPLSRRTWRLPTTACEHRPTARACHERRSNRPNGNRTTTPPRTSSGRREGTSTHYLKHPSPLDSTPTTSSPTTRRLPVSTTFGPSCPSCWTRRLPTTLAVGGRSSSPCSAMLSPTMSSTTTSPRHPWPGP
jgi:hypothetical protein